MKYVYFVRHAKSSWKDLQLSDHDRPLNKRGKKDAPFMGDLIRSKNVMPELLLSSTAKRAFSTAKHFSKSLAFDKEDIVKQRSLYHSDESTLLSTLHNLLDEYTSVMLFIHNPGITDIVNYCTKANLFNIPTAAVAGIQFEVNHWDEIDQNGTMFLYEYPKKYYNEFGEGPLLQS